MNRWVAAASRCGWVAVLLVCLGGAAQAQPQPPAPMRVGRIAAVQGDVRRLDSQAGQWVAALRNGPLLQGDRLAAAPGGAAELQIGASALRLAGDTEVEATRLDDERVQLTLAYGSLAVRLGAAELASDFEVTTPDVRWQALREGLYRIDRRGETSAGSNWRGLLRAATPELTLTVEPGQRLELPAGAGNAAARWSQPLDDAFAAGFLRDAELAGSTPDAVPAQITGVADLARYGTWQQHPQFGWVWSPVGMAPNWAPYRYGQWVWMQPWGWTWVDAAPWGFAPFHYGRWFPWGSRWYWAPGPVQPRPVRPRHLGPPPLGLPPSVLPPPVMPGPGFDPRVPVPAPMPLPAMPRPQGWLHRHDGPPGLQGDEWLHRAAPPAPSHAATPRERSAPRPSVALDTAAPPPAPRQPTGPYGGPPRAALAVAERAPPPALAPPPAPVLPPAPAAPPGAARAPMPHVQPFRPAAADSPPAAPPQRQGQHRGAEPDGAAGQATPPADRRPGPRER
ncbi:MAG TPA: hypothetical protein PLB41_18590 [Rubrivivax sp.]|nr:hypothetical protein [Rubrivivax sp.]